MARWLAKWLQPEGAPELGQVGVGGIFIRFSYSVLPIALSPDHRVADDPDGRFFRAW